MTARLCRRSILLATLLLALVLGAGSVLAQNTYPTRVDATVNDFAELLTAEHAAALRSMLAEVRADTGIEVTVVTLDSIHDYATGDTSIESFATNLFNTWGLGDVQRNDGVLLLVAWKDREMRIEVGSGYGDTLNADMQAIIDTEMLPAFRRENYSQGIYNGARALSRRLYALSGRSAPALLEDMAETAPSSPNTISIPLILAGLAGAAGASAYGAGRYARYHKRRCPNCQTYMDRLDEVADDVHLDSGQKAEELLQSVDYDVWKCPACNYYTLHGYNRWLSGFGKCTSCNYHTLNTDSRTISSPTYTSTGTKLITRDCRHCQAHSEQRVTLPMLTRSTSTSRSYSSSRSSSSSRSGGGRSRGGGASGKW